MILVYLEQHEGELEKGSLGVLGKAASLGETAGVVLGPGAADAAAKAGAFGASNVYALEDESLAASVALAERRGPFPAWQDSRWHVAGHRPLRNATSSPL